MSAEQDNNNNNNADVDVQALIAEILKESAKNAGNEAEWKPVRKAIERAMGLVPDWNEHEELLQTFCRTTWFAKPWGHEGEEHQAFMKELHTCNQDRDTVAKVLNYLAELAPELENYEENDEGDSWEEEIHARRGEVLELYSLYDQLDARDQLSKDAVALCFEALASKFTRTERRNGEMKWRIEQLEADNSKLREDLDDTEKGHPTLQATRTARQALDGAAKRAREIQGWLTNEIDSLQCRFESQAREAYHKAWHDSRALGGTTEAKLNKAIVDLEARRSRMIKEGLLGKSRRRADRAAPTPAKDDAVEEDAASSAPKRAAKDGAAAEDDAAPSASRKRSLEGWDSEDEGEEAKPAKKQK